EHFFKYVHSVLMYMVDSTTDAENIAGRLERLPYSRFHTKFALMLASGEWAESLMLLGNGAILTLVAAYYGITGNLSAFGIPAFFLCRGVYRLYPVWQDSRYER
ncbi:metabolite transporter, partial [mine drainage metagenome]